MRSLYDKDDCHDIMTLTAYDTIHVPQCYVMTANLDGETSLKTRVSAPLTRELRTEAQAGGMFGCIGGA